MGVASDAKHREHPLKLKSSVESQKKTFSEEISRAVRDIDAKLDRLHALATTSNEALGIQMREELEKFADDSESKIREEHNSKKSVMEASETRLKDEICRLQHESSLKPQW